MNYSYRAAYVEVPQLASLEIDTPKDLELAELLMQNEHLLHSTDNDGLINIPKTLEKTKSRHLNSPNYEL